MFMWLRLTGEGVGGSNVHRGGCRPVCSCGCASQVRGERVCRGGRQDAEGCGQGGDPPPSSLILTPYPLSCAAIVDFDERAAAAFVEHSVACVPGRLFWADQGAVARGAPCPYLRVSFGGLHEPQINEGFRRIAAALRAAAAAAAEPPLQ